MVCLSLLLDPGAVVGGRRKIHTGIHGAEKEGIAINGDFHHLGRAVEPAVIAIDAHPLQLDIQQAVHPIHRLDLVK